MSAHSGPNINNNGLVLAFDEYNINKSWKGIPTTNLADVSISGMSGVSLTYLGMNGRWKKYAMSGTFTGGTYPYILGITAITFTGGTTYSSSCYIKTNALSKFNYFGTGMNYVNQPMNKGGTSFSIPQTDGSFYIGRSNFAYTSTTAQTGYILSNPINNITFNSAADFIWIKDGQIELGENPTPFAGNLGTRSNTQTIKDITNNNTITANSLTYATDNTFSFNGTNNFCTISDTTALSFESQQFAFDYWVYFNNTTSNNGIIGKGEGSWEYAIYANGTNGLQFYSWPVSGAGPVYTPPLTTTFVAGRWYHHCWTANGTNSFLYVNGVLTGTNNKSGTYSLGNGTSRVTIGAGGDASGLKYLNGKLSKLKIYNRFLTQAEILQNYNTFRGRFLKYKTITYTATSNVTLTNNGTQEVTMFKNTGNGTWNGEVRSTETFAAPCTIEFSKQSGVTDNISSYAMIGWNEDPITNTSYTSMDHASYPYRSDNYSVYNNGSQVHYGGAWDVNKRFYIVYDTDGYIRHYNGSTLLYSANYGTNKIVGVDSSFWAVNSTFGGFTNVKVISLAWNGTNYV